MLDILDGTMRVCTPIKEYHAILKIFRGLLSLINYIGSYAFELVMSVEFLNGDPYVIELHQDDNMLQKEKKSSPKQELNKLMTI